MRLDPPLGVAVDRSQVLKAAASLGMLGTATHGAPRIMAALCNQAVSTPQLAALVRREPALYARVLKVANSSYYGQSKSVTHIERALLLLGGKAIAGIVAAACLDRGLARGRGIPGVDVPALLQHSLATAAASESLARIRHAELAADAFIAGLLHDLGVIVQAQVDTSGLQRMNELRHAGDLRSIPALESEIGLIGHEECIAVVFEEWGLPAPLIAAVRHHHDPARASEPHRVLASLVHVGAALSCRIYGNPASGTATEFLERSVLDKLALREADIEGVAARLPDQLAELRSSGISQ